MKRKTEIGSEFWDVPVVDQQNNLFPESTQWYLSGRSALQAIIYELGEARTVSLPSWCCDSMIKPFVDMGLEVHFYPVYWSEGQLRQEWLFDSDILFLIDYFGYIGNTPGLSGYNGTVIRDVTHSIFSMTYSDADFYFGSLRKWCGMWTGGYAWTRDGHQLEYGRESGEKYIVLRKKAMTEKAKYIEGIEGDKGYLKLFDEAEKYLDYLGIAPAANRDVDLVQRLDTERIMRQRRANAEVLRQSFPDWLLFPNSCSSDTPMFVPVLVPDGKRDALRQYLIENEIYCPVHWPVSEYHKLSEKTAYIYQNELSLVCDQRYTEDDMNRVVEIINTFERF